jgi:hypothetical protein
MGPLLLVVVARSGGGAVPPVGVGPDPRGRARRALVGASGRRSYPPIALDNRSAGLSGGANICWPTREDRALGWMVDAHTALSPDETRPARAPCWRVAAPCAGCQDHVDNRNGHLDERTTDLYIDTSPQPLAKIAEDVIDDILSAPRTTTPTWPCLRSHWVGLGGLAAGRRGARVSSGLSIAPGPMSAADWRLLAAAGEGHPRRGRRPEQRREGRRRMIIEGSPLGGP